MSLSFLLNFYFTFFICHCFGTEIFMSKIKSTKLLLLLLVRILFKPLYHGHFLLPHGGRCGEVQLCCMSVDDRTISNSSHRLLLNIWRYSLYTDVVLSFFSFFWKTLASARARRFISYHTRSTDFEEKIEGLWTGYWR